MFIVASQPLFFAVFGNHTLIFLWDPQLLVPVDFVVLTPSSKLQEWVYNPGLANQYMSMPHSHWFTDGHMTQISQ